MQRAQAWLAYRALVAAWDAARDAAKVAGGELTLEQDIAHVGEIDRVWTLLSEDEKIEADRGRPPRQQR